MAVIGGVAAVVVGATGFGVYALVGGDSGGESVAASGESGSDTSVQTGPASAHEVRTTAKKFLTSWNTGSAVQAAHETDQPAAAAKALAALRSQAHISKLTVTPHSASGAKVPFAVTAQINYGGQTSALDWTSSLEVVRNKSTGEPQVKWDPSVLYPKLKQGQQIVTGKAGTPPIKAVDRNGVELTAQQHPELTGILADLRRRYGDKAGGTPGVETRIVDAKGNDTGMVLKTLSQGTPGTLKTTLDSKIQAAAQKAVSGKKNASAVAVKPSTGEILAVANSPAKGYNSALMASLAPGSTMKIVTSEMLMDKGLTSPNKKDPCPKVVKVAGWKFHNDGGMEIKNGTFAQSFAASCNNAFIKEYTHLQNDSLTKEAKEVFGLGANWNVGTGTFDGAVPVQDGAQMGASLIGQGGVRMDPLNIASVAATAQSGTFHQPIIVSPDLDHRKIAQASRKMKPEVNKALKYLMKLTATQGTAAKPMAGLSGDFGAKTGSAEVDSQKKPNAWFTAYHGDLASAAVVPASGHGNENAGPVVRAILDAGGQ